MNSQSNDKIYASNSLDKKGNILNRIERFGYKSANFAHKIFVLSLFGFIVFNVGFFIKEYNSYWRARRVKNIFFYSNIIYLILFEYLNKF